MAAVEQLREMVKEMVQELVASVDRLEERVRELEENASAAPAPAKTPRAKKATSASPPTDNPFNA